MICYRKGNACSAAGAPKVSPTHFMDVKAGASCLDLQLSGAIPPITEARAMDTAGKAAIVQSERQAAKTLIQKGRQDMLQNYYRTLEEIRDNEFAEAQRARQEEDEILHREHVRREHFEMQHRRREFAIVHELHRRERRRVFDASRTVLVIDRLAEEQRKRRFELHLRQERAKEQREQSRQRRPGRIRERKDEDQGGREAKGSEGKRKVEE
eukprot:Skav212945  [mRNA]  locus=scaffold374:547870:549734:- [translate_table: standard]